MSQKERYVLIVPYHANSLLGVRVEASVRVRRVLVN